MSRVVRFFAAMFMIAALLVSSHTAVLADERVATPVPLGRDTSEESIDEDFTAQADESVFTVGVSFTDSGLIPAGLTWTLFADGWVAVDSGPVTAGATSFLYTLPAAVPYGRYGIWITGSGYSVGQSIVFDNLSETHSFTLERQSGSVIVTFETSDSGLVPVGSIWTLRDSGGVSIASGAVALEIADGGSLVLPNSFEFGSYSLDIVASGYSNVTVPFTLTANPTPVTVNLVSTAPPVTESTVTITIDTFDDSDIPAGTQWSLSTADWAEVAGGTFDSATVAPQIIALPTPVAFGTYHLVVRTAGEIFFYNAGVVVDQATHTFAVVITNTDTPEGNEATVDLTISTDDGSNIPAGTTWMLTLADAEYTPVQSGSVPPASPSPFNVVLPSPVPWGQYVFFAVTPENVYYGGQVVNIFEDSFSYSFEFVHLQSEVAATVSTGDAADIPAGTTWSITDADSTVIQSGTLADAVPTGSALPLTNPIDYGVYSVVITATEGYLPFTTSITVNEPSSSFEFTLQPPAPITGTVDLVVTTSDGGGIPTGTIITIGGVSYTVPASDASAAAIASGTTIPFADVPEGVQTLTVSNASPYLDLTDSLDIIAGESIDAAIELQLAPVPTPDPQGTVTPGEPQTPVPTAEPTDEVPDDGSVVTTLPSTGQGRGSSSNEPLILLAFAAMLIVGGSVIAKRRINESR